MKRRKKLGIAQVVALSMVAFSVLCMPFTDYLVRWLQNEIPIYINGALFWLSILILIVITVRLTGLRKRSAFYKKNVEGCKQIGLIHFFQNKWAIFVDVMMILALAGFVGVLVWAPQYLILSFVLLAVFVFSFGMHCILNGANYIFINGYRRGENHE